MAEQRDFDNFDEFAKDYRHTHDQSVKMSGASSDYFSEYKIVELLRHENAQAEMTILDFGCGDGNSSVYIRKYFPHASIHGIDVSGKSIEEANAKAIKNASFQAFDGKQIPFQDDLFDVVFTSMVFHHIDHQLHEGILKEIHRILKPGGRFYNFEHNPNNPLTRKVVRECPFDEDAVLLKPSYHKHLINNSALRLEKVKYTLFFPRHKLFKPFLTLENLLSWCPVGAQYYMKAIK
ncbi:MAG: class I SAM-dependent methyltransferase [Flavobacteriales bacterium]|nr:class I SAM-dependent methyltransferase [Flavobacteriales bacterium]